MVSEVITFYIDSLELAVITLNVRKSDKMILTEFPLFVSQEFSSPPAGTWSLATFSEGSKRSSLEELFT